MSQRVISVSQLVQYLKKKLDSDGFIQRIMIQGEISNFTNHRSGHWYFTLKDDKSRISCVMFQGYAKMCAFLPKDGDKVILTANTSLFEASGQLQLYGIKMQLDGLGDLYLRFEQLKRKLQEEGLFEASLKKVIPEYPLRIGLITGRNTAAREDVVSTLQRRWPIAEIIEFPVLVQGESAPHEIIQALTNADDAMLDVILLVRGGGSIEDLWAFNNEALARKIVSLKTPLISGVGHEVDITIVDYVADLRAPTPTGAAEMASPELAQIQQQLVQTKIRLNQRMDYQLTLYQQKLKQLRQSRIFQNPAALFEVPWMRLDQHLKQLRLVTTRLAQQQYQFEQSRTRLSMEMQKSCQKTASQLADKENTLKQATLSKLQQDSKQLASQAARLDAYSPLKSLQRGYSLTYQNHQLVTSLKQVQLKQTLIVQLQDGKVVTEVITKEENHE